MPDDELQITTIRLFQKDLDRAEALTSRVRPAPEFTGIGKIKRGHVLRVAMLRGLEALEAEFPAQEGSPNSTSPEPA